MGKELAKTGAMPAFLKKDKTEGLDGLKHDDYTIPRLLLCQSISPQRIKGNSKHIQGLEEGMYFNSITGEVYGDTLTVVPVLISRSRVKFWPKDSGKTGVECASKNAVDGGSLSTNCESCSHSQFQENAAPKCNDNKDYICIVVKKDGTETVAFTLKSSGVKIAKVWNTLMRMRETSIYSGMYTLTSTAETNSNNEPYFEAKVNNAGWVDEAMYEKARSAHITFKTLMEEGELEVVEGNEATQEEETTEEDIPI